LLHAKSVNERKVFIQCCEVFRFIAIDMTYIKYNNVVIIFNFKVMVFFKEKKDNKPKSCNGIN